MTIGKRIQAARKKKGLTQKELAAELELATGSIQQYELDKRQPRLEQLQKIANKLEVPLSELTGEPIKIHLPMPDYPFPIPSRDQIERMTAAELEYFQLRLLADTDPDALKQKLDDSYGKLNKLGKVEVVRRSQELAKLEEYTQPDPNNKPVTLTVTYQSAETTKETPDTSHTETATTEPQEGK